MTLLETFRAELAAYNAHLDRQKELQLDIDIAKRNGDELAVADAEKAKTAAVNEYYTPGKYSRLKDAFVAAIEEAGFTVAEIKNMQYRL